MIKTCFLYLGYALTTAAVTSVTYLNLAPQFGSNPSKKEKIEYEKLTNFEDGIFINSEDTPLMTGEVSTWDFFRGDSLRKPKNLETEIPFGPHLVVGCILYVVLIDQIFDFLI